MNGQARSASRWTRRLAALVAPVLVVGAGLAPAIASAHEDGSPAWVAVEWNQALVQALTVENTPPPTAMRAGAIVQVSVFDAVDGLSSQYLAYHLPGTAPRGASAPAAAAGAAHQALVTLFPAEQTGFDALLASDLTRLRDDAGDSEHDAVRRGVAWGVSVADAILALRAHDGFTTPPPPYRPNPGIGHWRPTPPAFVPAPAFRQFAAMTPWALASPGQFLPGLPPALTSARYTQDFNEVKAYGAANSTARSGFQTQTAQLWQSAAPVTLWDGVADALIASRDLDLTDATHLLALANMAMADAVIAIWNAKNFYDTWRPVTAIQKANLDNNPLTEADPTWQPLLVTPAFQEYPAGHPGVSAAAAAVLAERFGDHTTYTITSPAMTAATRTLPSFSAGVQQVIDARVFGGIHFRFAGDTAAVMGRQVAAYVYATQLQPRRCPGQG
jgi:hypothetical protein